MHKKSRSKKGPRQPPQSSVNKPTSITVDPELKSQSVTENVDNIKEQRVPDPNPELLCEVAEAETTELDKNSANTPSKPKRHRGGRKKKQTINEKNLGVESEITNEGDASSNICEAKNTSNVITSITTLNELDVNFSSTIMKSQDDGKIVSEGDAETNVLTVNISDDGKHLKLLDQSLSQKLNENSQTICKTEEDNIALQKINDETKLLKEDDHSVNVKSDESIDMVSNEKVEVNIIAAKVKNVSENIKTTEIVSKIKTNETITVTSQIKEDNINVSNKIDHLFKSSDIIEGLQNSRNKTSDIISAIKTSDTSDTLGNSNKLSKDGEKIPIPKSNESPGFVSENKTDIKVSSAFQVASKATTVIDEKITCDIDQGFNLKQNVLPNIASNEESELILKIKDHANNQENISIINTKNQKHNEMLNISKSKGQGKKSKKKGSVSQNEPTTLLSLHDATEEQCFKEQLQEIKEDLSTISKKLEDEVVQSERFFADNEKLSQSTDCNLDIQKINNKIFTDVSYVADSSESININPRSTGILLENQRSNVHEEQGSTDECIQKDSYVNITVKTSENTATPISEISDTFAKKTCQDDGNADPLSDLSIEIEKKCAISDVSSSFTTKLFTDTTEIKQTLNEESYKKKGKSRKHQIQHLQHETISKENIIEQLNVSNDNILKKPLKLSECEQVNSTVLQKPLDILPPNTDFIASPSEISVNLKHTDMTDQMNVNIVSSNDQSTEYVDVSKSIASNLQKQKNSKVVTIENKQDLIPLLVKEPLLMICEKKLSATEEISNEKEQVPVSLEPKKQPSVSSASASNSCLTIAEEIAESIKEELKCQLAIISGGQGNATQRQILTEQNIKDIGEETEKNVVKNIESIMKTVEPAMPTEKSHNVVASSSQKMEHEGPDNMQSGLSIDKKNTKGKGKSKKGNKREKEDVNTSIVAQCTSQTITTAPSTQANEKTEKANEPQSSPTEKKPSSTSEKDKDSDSSVKDKDKNINNEANNDLVEPKCDIDENKDLIREIGYFCINDDKDSLITFDNDMKNNGDDFEYIQQISREKQDEQKQNDKDTQSDSKDGEKKTVVTRPKNLLGHPNIPVSSNKVDYKKEKNKTEESGNADDARVNLLMERENAMPETSATDKTENNVKFKTKDPFDDICSQPLSLKGVQQKPHNFEEDFDPGEGEEEFVYKYNFRNVFLANACHTCKQPIQKHRFNCEYCHLLSYCSERHKDKDWAEHQSLCYAVTNIMQINGLTHLYCKSKALAGHEYRVLRMQMIVLCEKLLKRKLTPSEQETLLYPRLCLSQECREYQKDKLADCDKCGQVSYCKDIPEHLTEDHKNWCHSYDIYHKLVAHQLEKGKVEPKLPNRIMSQGYVLPNNCTALMGKLLDKNIGMDECHYTTLSQLSTGPLTALYSYQQWLLNSDPKDNMLIPTKLTIHIVGAEMQFEMDTLNKWEAFFMHLCPRLNDLCLVFIGPELNPSKLPLDLLSKIRLCKFCRQTNKNIKIQFCDGVLYHDFVRGSSFTKPDLVCAFNPGLHRTTGYAGQDTWPETIRSITNLSVPFCVTSYTKQELPRDLIRVLSCANGNVKTYVAPRLNPYASLRPDRNFISDDEMPLIFKNYYFMVLSGLFP